MTKFAKNFTVILMALLMLTGFAFADLFITEIADPNNEAGARYVEIYNNGVSSVDLSTGWDLQRWTNESTTPQTAVELTGTIAAGDFYVVCANQTTFTSTYGFAADQSIGTGGPADSNGDDQIALRNASDVIVDMFGVVGEDGSGTAHEFEDGRAERKATVVTGTDTWDAGEWNIDNDSGGGDGAQDAPAGFDPAAWIGASTPTITLSSASLSGFTYVVGNGPSDEQTFTASGSDLTANITITPSTNYEISTGTGGSFVATNPITLTQSGGSVAETTIYVRLKAGLTTAEYNSEIITASSTDADNKTVTCNGSVTAVEPDWDHTELFTNFPESSTSYNTGTFTGADGSTWNYIQTGGASAIESPSPLLGKDRSPAAEVYSGTISTTGVKQMQFQFKQVYSTNVNLEVYVNAVKVYTATTSSETGITKSSGLIDVNIDGDVVIKFSQPAGAGQVSIDNLKWTNMSEVPLPITLESFTATAVNGTVELAWETASETNNARFVIYRNGEAIGSVDGAGTSSEPHTYTFVDDAVVPGVAYTYVLADVDYANKETRYENDAVSVTVPNDLIEADFVINAAYPNPFNPSVTVNYQLFSLAHVKASVYNTNGELIGNLLDSDMAAGSHDLVWNAVNMPSGVYILKMLSGDIVNTQKLVLMK